MNWKHFQIYTQASMHALAYLHTIHSILWKSWSTLSSSGLVLEKIRSCWQGSFNWVLSRKSYSMAPFIFCHFTMCECMCVCASLCLRGNKGCFPKMFCAHAHTCLYGFWLAVSFRVQFKENVVVCEFFPPLRLRQYLCALFLMICEFIYSMFAF